MIQARRRPAVLSRWDLHRLQGPSEVWPDRPVAGHYRMRLVKGGPWVPVMIWQGYGLDPETRQVIERGWIWRAMQYDDEVDVWSVWPACAGEPIKPEEYRYQCALRRHALAHDPSMPEADPRKPVDWNKLRFQF
jgi:hypothetical protein